MIPLDDGAAAAELDRLPVGVRRLCVVGVDGAPTLVAADRYGLVRVWNLETSALRAEINVGSGINGLAADGVGRICVATDMGLAALRLNPSVRAERRETP